MCRLNQSLVGRVHLKPQLPVGTPSTPWLGVPHGTKSRPSFVEDFHEHIKPSIQLSAGTTRNYDGPKVAMSGDRLVNVTGVSRRQRCQSTIGESRKRTLLNDSTTTSFEHNTRRHRKFEVRRVKCESRDLMLVSNFELHSSNFRTPRRQP